MNEDANTRSSNVKVSEGIFMSIVKESNFGPVERGVNVVTASAADGLIAMTGFMKTS